MQHGGEEDTVALAAKDRKKKTNKKGPKEGGKKKKGVEQQRDMSKVKCFACHKFGHYVIECPNTKKRVVAFADMKEFSSKLEREFSLIACISPFSRSSRVWYINNRASTHMSEVREVFFELTERDLDVEVELANDRVVRVVSKGTVAFQRESRPPLRFQDVYYVSRLKKNLISVSTIENKGPEVLFRDGRVYILPKVANFALAKVISTRCGKLYKLGFRPMSILMSNSNEDHFCELWHKRMAHLHHGALRVLKEIVTSLSQFSTDHKEVCRGCALGKYTKASFSSSEHRANRVLDLIHSNVSSSMSTLSLSGHEYYMTFINDFSRKT